MAPNELIESTGVQGSQVASSSATQTIFGMLWTVFWDWSSWMEVGQAPGSYNEAAGSFTVGLWLWLCFDAGP